MELAEDTVLELSHVDTCLSCYWSGHHLPHVQISVHKNMTLSEIKSALHTEISEGAVCGSALDWEQLESELWYQKAKEAIDKMEPNDKEQTVFFTDLEEETEEDYSGESIYAFFVFAEV